VLPFSKRQRSQEASELINTSEIEVVNRARAVESNRPRPFMRTLSDEEKTVVLPGSGNPPPATALPQVAIPKAAPVPGMKHHAPATARPASSPPPNMRGAMKQRLDEEFTMLRPQGAHPSSRPPAPVAAGSPPSAPRTPSARPPAKIPTPFQPIVPVGQARPMSRPPTPAKAAKPPTPVDAIRPHTSDITIPPATVIPSRPRLLGRKPAASWAMALMAVGIFLGLVTAVVARGDADALIDATASFVDPSHKGVHGGQAAAAAAGLPATAPKPQATVVTVAAPAAEPASVPEPAPTTPVAAVVAPQPAAPAPLVEVAKPKPAVAWVAPKPIIVQPKSAPAAAPKPVAKGKDAPNVAATGNTTSNGPDLTKQADDELAAVARAMGK
jgi:hypothetical protein